MGFPLLGCRKQWHQQGHKKIKSVTEGKMDNTFDVIVIGGGTAGVIAALQSARADHKTLLVEKNALPGGTMTAGAIVP